MEVPQKKLKTELPYDPVISLLGIFLKECTPGYDRTTCTPLFIAALFTVTSCWLSRSNFGFLKPPHLH
jgi:hypothetical protein